MDSEKPLLGDFGWPGFFALGFFLISSAQTQIEPFNNAVNLSDSQSQYVTVPGGIWFSNAFIVEAWVNVRTVGNWSRLIEFGKRCRHPAGRSINFSGSNKAKS